jgi:hypothetical protein
MNGFDLSVFCIVATCLLTPAVKATVPHQIVPSAQSPDAQLIAQELGCPRAMPVAYYATATYHVSICEGQDGYLFYRGVEFLNTDNAINVPDVSETGDYAYVATNGDVSYEIDPTQLTVYQNGAVIWQEPVISWSTGDEPQPFR